MTITYLRVLLMLSVCLSACTQPGVSGDEPASILEMEARWWEPIDLQPIELEESEKLNVVATTTIVGDIVSFIGGNDIELTVLMPSNVDPHAYEPTPADLRKLSDAHVIFLNGGGLENSIYDFLEPLAESVPILSVSQGIEFRKLAADEEGGGIDPHVWFDPGNVKHWVGRITATLSKLHPSVRDSFEEHAQTYNQFLDHLDDWIKERVDQIPVERRIIVSDHYIFGYFADRYGFDVVGAVLPVFSSAAEPSAQEIVNLEETISQLQVRVIFVGLANPTGVAANLAEDRGIQLVELYTGSLSGPEGPAASYLNFMQYNVTEIVNALME